MRRLSLVLFLPTTAFATDVHVPDDYPTFDEALAAASPNDTIVLADGTYEIEATITQNLTIEADTDATVVIQNTLGSSGQIFDVDGSTTFIMNDIQFAASGHNRAVRLTNVNIARFENVTVTGLSTPGSGAFVDATDSLSISFDGVSTTNTTAGMQGGVLAFHTTHPGSSAVLRIDQSQIETASADIGGAVYAEHANVTLIDSTLTDCIARIGGAIYTTSDTTSRDLDITRTSFDGNFSTEDGGAVYSVGLDIDLADVSFTENIAGGDGVAYLKKNTVIHPSIRANLRIDASTFANNSAVGTGGAIWGDVSDVQIDDTTFTHTDSAAEAIHLSAVDVDLTNVNLTDNTATTSQAGLRAAITGTFDYHQGTVHNNTTTDGTAALRIDTIGRVLLSDLDIANNTTNGAGAAGGVEIHALEVEIKDTVFADNTGLAGGAVAVSGPQGPHDVATVSFTDVNFFRNNADIGSAFYGRFLTDVSSTRSFFCENSSADSTFFAEGTGSFVTRNDGASDNTADNGAVYKIDGFSSADIGFGTFVGNIGTTTVLHAETIAGHTLFDHSVLVNNHGTSFYGMGVGTFLSTHNAQLSNTSDFAADWIGTTHTDPFTPTAPQLFNSYPAVSCETTAIWPHPSSDLIDVGPGTHDINSSLTDIGISGGTSSDLALLVDADGDGFIRLDDCDDNRPESNPDAPDLCNGLDDDCDGTIDEDPETVWFEDGDSDGFGSASIPGHPQCDPPTATAVSNGEDCDDTDAAINPSADEVCDGIDNNCDTITDDDAIDAPSWFLDQDFDTFGDDALTLTTCIQPVGYSAIGGDCDDQQAAVNPDAEERCDTIDNDCDGTIDIDGANAPTWYPDVDQDGFGAGVGVIQCLPPEDHSPFDGDCDDNEPLVSPGRHEVCDGLDNDCDGHVDIDPIEPLYFPDHDGDGYGDQSATPIGSCHPLSNLVENGEDCDDTNNAINPDAQESCDGVDEDCDGTLDNNPTNGHIYYLDSDDDGFGNDLFEIIACTKPSIASEVGGDCDDNNAVSFPGNTEICDFWDNDCDGDVDEDDAVGAPTWYQDADQDGVGTDLFTQTACDAPIGHVPVHGDCDDTNPISYPGRLEVCDGVDNDCDGVIDGPDAEDVSFFFEDADGDGFGNPNVQIGACTLPDGYVTNDNDCDDTNNEAFPGADEIAGNGVDEDCNEDDLPANTPDDTDTSKPPEPCGCSNNGAAPWLFGPFLAALFIRRRQ